MGVGSYSFVCNVLYARDPRETRIYCQHCSREYKNKQSSRINTAYVPLQVIFVPVDSDAYRQWGSPFWSELEASLKELRA